MAFDKSNFSRMASYGNAPQFFMYTTADDATDVDTADYFLEVIDDVRLGDLLYVVANNVPGFMYCNENDGTTIDVSDMDALTILPDTD